MIYLDHAATTPVPAARGGRHVPGADGSSSATPPPSIPWAGRPRLWWRRAAAVVAGALGCRPENLHFTSCGTESDNWAISAAVWQGRHTGRHIITTAVEHSAVLEPC